MRGWWTLAASAAVIMALLATIGLPTLFPVLRAGWVRILLIALVGTIAAIVAAWRWWRGRKASAELAERLADTPPAEAEDDVLAGRMRDALAQLKKAAGGRGRYLYAKPWYVIIGPPGAGKTTALLRSGVRFPWSDSALKGAGGTRNLDFWFAEDAVLVDTAGRYTTQDSETAVDSAGWEQFLRLLRRTRPLQPVNGVLVALGVDELMSATRDQIDLHAAAVSRRLAELRRMLGVSAPLYLLFPKVDMLAGFTEFFADLDAEGRRAVLGATMSPGEPVDTATAITAFDRMVEAVSARGAKRLQEEPDQRRRSLILAFPAQLLSLRARIHRFVEGACFVEREPPHLLRGFYFASGVQQGAPLDRVLSAMATVYDDQPTAASADAGGRAFFLNRLLTEVVFPEAGMVRAEPAIIRLRRMTAGAAIGAMALLGLLMIGLWSGSFARNKTFQGALLAAGQRATAQGQAEGIDLAEVRDSDPDLEQALPLLDRLRRLPHGYEAAFLAGPSWSMRLGLYQAGHADAARQAYLDALQRVVLPRLLLRLEAVMREPGRAPVTLYEPLKAYLMLGGYGPLDRRSVRAWVTQDWRATSLAGADRAEARARLARHLDTLLADPDLGRVWAGRRAPLDGGLIAATRAALQTLSLADRAYAALRQRANAAGRKDWLVGAVLAGGDAKAFRNGDAVLAAGVPWFFTAEGYRQAYQPGLLDVEAELGRDLWVLGPDAAKASIRDQLPFMRAAIAGSYARDYIVAWDGLLAVPQPADYFGDRAALGAFTRNPSPLKTLLLEVRRNTALGSGGLPTSGGVDAGRMIHEHFRGLGDFAGTTAATPAPVDDLVRAVRQAAAADAAAGAPGATLGGGAAQGQFASALGDLSTAGVVAPPQLQSFVAQAARSGRGAATRRAEASLDRQYSSAVLPGCLAATNDRYPFATAASRDVGAVDLQRVYGPNGLIDGFVRGQLLPILDTGAWRWRSGDPVAARFKPASATAFGKAAAIGDLTAGGLAMNVNLVRLGDGVDEVEVSIGNTTFRVGKGDGGSHPVIWTPATLPQAYVAIFSNHKEVHRDQMQGLWALFRLVDLGHPRNAGASTIRVRFGTGEQEATLAIVLPSAVNPFSRGGPFSFRCPPKL